MSPTVRQGGRGFAPESTPSPEIDDTPGGGTFVALLKAFRASGGIAPAHGLECLRAEYAIGGAASLPKLILAGEIFGFTWCGNLWMPMFQFAPDDLSVRPGPRRVRDVLPSSWTPWALAAWFASPSLFLDDQCPTDVLEVNLVATLDAARSVDAVGQLAQARIRVGPRLAANGAARESRA